MPELRDHLTSEHKGNPITHALTAKVKIGGKQIPVGLIALFVAGIVYYYYKKQSASSSTTNSTAATSGLTTGNAAPTGYYTSPAGQGGGAALGAAATMPYQTPVTSPVSWDPTQMTSPNTVPDAAGNGVYATQTIPAPVNTQPAANAGSPAVTPRLSQPYNPAGNPLSETVLTANGRTRKIQPLVWGGQTFYTKSSFLDWTSKHGIASSTLFANHPEAQRIYNGLAAGTLKTSQIVPAKTVAAAKVPAARAKTQPLAAPKAVSQPSTVRTKPTSAPQPQQHAVHSTALVPRTTPVVKRTAVGGGGRALKAT